VLLFTNNLLNKKMKHSRKSTRLKSMRGVPTSSRLHLSHPKHTGKLIHHSSTSYPVLAMLLLVVGVLLGGMTHRTQAGSLYGSGTGQYVISASVPGPAPKVAAIINTPVDGVHSSVSPITVAGSCPVDTYISLYRNGLFSGVSLCTIDGKWNIETSLFAGRNDLVAKVFNLTDVPGPVVGGITVFYDLPTVPINSPGSPSSGASTLSQSNQTPLPVPTIHPSSKSPLPAIDTTANANTLTLKSSFLYKGYYANQPATWQFAVDGGNAPYAISIDWGDGYRSLISRPFAGEFRAEHVYMKQGAYHGSYVIKATATDATNNETVLQVLAIINERPGSSSLDASGGINAPGSSPGIMRYLLPSYGIVVLMVASFWLGEIRELRHVRPRRSGRSHRA
jgi:hypothetical protein